MAKVDKSKAATDLDREFVNVFRQLSLKHGAHNVWDDFIVMSACSISNMVSKNGRKKRDELYEKAKSNYDEDEFELICGLLGITIAALNENEEQDYLGRIYQMLSLEIKSLGQVFTPYHIAELMAKLTMGNVAEEVKEKGYLSICDPTCGSGALLIAGFNETKRQLERCGMTCQGHILMAGQDIDIVTALACYTQLSLLGVPGYVKVGDSLSSPMTKEDSLNNYWFTPMYILGGWNSRAQRII